MHVVWQVWQGVAQVWVPHPLKQQPRRWKSQSNKGPASAWPGAARTVVQTAPSVKILVRSKFIAIRSSHSSQGRRSGLTNFIESWPRGAHDQPSHCRASLKIRLETSRRTAKINRKISKTVGRHPVVRRGQTRQLFRLNRTSPNSTTRGARGSVVRRRADRGAPRLVQLCRLGNLYGFAGAARTRPANRLGAV